MIPRDPSPGRAPSPNPSSLTCSTLFTWRSPPLDLFSSLTCSNFFTWGNPVPIGKRMVAFSFVVVLWSGCLGAWLRHLTRREVDVRMWTDCKLYYFMFYFGRHYSSMLLVLMSLEKCFAVYFPLKSKSVCTVKTAKWATGIVGVSLAGYNTVHFFLRESVNLLVAMCVE